MTRELIGKALGVLILLAFVLAVPYAFFAFVEWEANPGAWDDMSRALAAIVAAGGLFVLGTGVVQVWNRD